MKAIVTVKLKSKKHHDKRCKVFGRCPLYSNDKLYCTDVDGEHHSYIESGETLGEITYKAKLKYNHITRIEEIKDG